MHPRLVSAPILCALFPQGGCSRTRDREAMRGLELICLRVLMAEELLPFSTIEIAGKRCTSTRSRKAASRT